MALKQIRLELARTKDYPEGSAKHGYEFVAPLDGEGHLDMAEWKQYGQACIVHRFWDREDDETGQLVHKPPWLGLLLRTGRGRRRADLPLRQACLRRWRIHLGDRA